MNMNLLHDITFYVMYGAAALAAFVVVERCIFFSYSLRKARQLVPAVNGKVRSIADLPAGLTARDSLPLQLLSQIYDGRRQLHSHQELEDLGQAIYISMRGKLSHSLWILEAVVAGAPLNVEFGKARSADAYGRDAAVAVETAMTLTARKHDQMPA